MRKIIFVSLLSLVLHSCSYDDLDIAFQNSIADISEVKGDNNQGLVSVKSLKEIQTDSSSIATTSNNSVLAIYEEYIKKSSDNQNRLSRTINSRATTIDGTANGTPKKTLSNQKVSISGVTGLAAGVYFADVYITSGQINLPTNAKDVEFDLPDVCGYIDWSSREEGVIKSTFQTKKDGVNKKYIKWSFYTIVLVYNAAGAQMWKVLPKDGAKIYLPYRFVY